MSIERSFLRYRNRLEKVFGKRNRDRNGNGKRRIPIRQNKVLFEPLEPRLLLSSDLTYMAPASTAIDATLCLSDVGGTDTIQLVDNRDQSVLQSQPLADTNAVVITGAEQDDKLTVDFSNPFSVPIQFDGGTQTSSDGDSIRIIGDGKISGSYIPVSTRNDAGIIYFGDSRARANYGERFIKLHLPNSRKPGCVGN
jgi:hypothetical protein